MIEFIKYLREWGHRRWPSVFAHMLIAVLIEIVSVILGLTLGEGVWSAFVAFAYREGSDALKPHETSGERLGTIMDYLGVVAALGVSVIIYRELGFGILILIWFAALGLWTGWGWLTRKFESDDVA